MKNIEIERKFLVTGNEYLDEAHKKERIIQGFLSSVPERTVRVRKVEDHGWITIKGIGNKSGTTRFEWEKPISGIEAAHLLDICEPGIIDKTRYYVSKDKHLFEIDVFHGLNEGLVVAEIELENEFDKYVSPSWLGEEVTGLIKYYNASLSNRPFSRW